MIRRETQRTRVTKPDLIAAALIYPVSMVTGLNSGDNFALTGNQFGGVGQDLMSVYDSGGSQRWRCGIVGGTFTIGRDQRAYNPAGTAYAALNGRSGIGCIELPDGSSAQGPKLWAGTGAPSASTVGAATSGDHYIRRPDVSAPTLLAMAHSTTTGSPITVGSGTLNANSTKDLDGVPVAGDLLVLVVENSETTVTATIGADAGKNADLTSSDGTRRARIFSQVLQPGDISSSQVTCTPSAHASGAGRRITAYIFRHPGGWATNGGGGADAHGCPLVGSATDTAGGTGPFTLTASAATTRATVAVAANNASVSTNTTYYWQSGNSSNKTSDMPGSANNATSSAKPGLGTNTSGTDGYSTGATVTVELASAGGTHAAALAVYQVAADTVNAADPIWYVCTASGTPGTWSQIL